MPRPKPTEPLFKKTFAFRQRYLDCLRKLVEKRALSETQAICDAIEHYERFLNFKESLDDDDMIVVKHKDGSETRLEIL